MALRHPRNQTVSDLMVTTVEKALPEEAAARVLARLEDGRHASAEAVAVIDAEGSYRGLVLLGTLVAHPKAPRIDALCSEEIVPVRPQDDQERAAHLALEQGTSVLPVVTEDSRFLGLITSHTLLRILRTEHAEDLQKLAGIVPHADAACLAIETSPWMRARQRAPWLLLGLAGSVGASLVVSRFDAVLAENLAVAYFVPTIVYLADAVGTQTEATVIRGLSLSHRPLPRLLLGELSTGAILGAFLGLLAMPVASLVFRAPDLALPVGISIFAAGTMASVIGLAIPWTLSKLKRDPAFGSGPIATVIQDALSLLVYFTTVAALR